jgi:hypothetical protein
MYFLHEFNRLSRKSISRLAHSLTQYSFIFLRAGASLVDNLIQMTGAGKWDSVSGRLKEDEKAGIVG